MSGLTTNMLLEAYRCGIFPMAEERDADELFWVEPKARGILPLDKFHVSKALRKTIKSGRFRVSVDTAFAKVIQLCASAQAGRKETWINDEIIELYTRLHEDGHVHSIEVWEMGALVGGLYGVSVGGAFCGESMFHLKTGASKVALAYTTARLKTGGYTLFDIQFVTDHLTTFGAISIPQKQYLVLLQKALKVRPNFYRLPGDASADEVMQVIAQTS